MQNGQSINETVSGRTEEMTQDKESPDLTIKMTEARATWAMPMMFALIVLFGGWIVSVELRLTESRQSAANVISLQAKMDENLGKQAINSERLARMEAKLDTIVTIARLKNGNVVMEPNPE